MKLDFRINIDITKQTVVVFGNFIKKSRLAMIPSTTTNRRFIL